MIAVLRRLSKIIMVRSALAVALAKSVGRADILHNLHYGFPVVFMQEDHNANYVT